MLICVLNWCYLFFLVFIHSLKLSWLLTSLFMLTPVTFDMTPSNFEYFITLFFSLAGKNCVLIKNYIFLLDPKYQPFFRNHQSFLWGQVAMYRSLGVPVTTSDNCEWTELILILQFKSITIEFFFTHCIFVSTFTHKTIILKMCVFSDFSHFSYPS